MATLQELLSSSDQSVRLKAALSAGTFPQSEYIPLLLSQCAHEPDFFVRDTLSWALMRHEKSEVVEQLKPELKSGITQARSQALHTLTKIGDKAFYSLITREHLLDANDKVAVTAWRSASSLAPEDKKGGLAEILVTQLGRGDSEMQFDLTRFLCSLGGCIVKPLRDAAQSANESIRMHAEFTMIRFQEMQLESTKKD
jgi:HEAT repeat protein